MSTVTPFFVAQDFISQASIDALMSRIEAEGECWIFRHGGRRPTIQVTLTNGEKVVRDTPRVAYRLFTGADPTGKVEQTCENPDCCRPEHLFVTDIGSAQAAGETQALCEIFELTIDRLADAVRRFPPGWDSVRGLADLGGFDFLFGNHGVDGSVVEGLEKEVQEKDARIQGLMEMITGAKEALVVTQESAKAPEKPAPAPAPKKTEESKRDGVIAQRVALIAEKHKKRTAYKKGLKGVKCVVCRRKIRGGESYLKRTPKLIVHEKCFDAFSK